jgi:transcriptional regulator with XRE-family HTH domain
VTGESPTLRQRELGVRMRELRRELGLTVLDVGEKLLCSPTKISRMETGARRPSLRDVRDLCQLYGVDQATSAELMNLARQAREEGWWKPYDDLGLEPYIGLEQDATTITCFSAFFVPALLQTEAYAEAIIKAKAPKISPEIHRQRVEARLRRQENVLERSAPPRYRALLDEAVLRRPVGSPAIMAAQLAKILELHQAKKATVQVIPFDVGPHAATDSNFVLLEIEDPLLDVVFVEGLTNNIYHERKGEVARYREAVEYLRDGALSPADSAQRIAEYEKIYAAELASA